MSKYDWKKLNHLQVGKYAEYYVKMEFLLHGLEVYTTEVDDRGIDCIIRKPGGMCYDVQVKSVRNMNYIIFTKDKFQPKESLLAGVVLLFEGKEPLLYLIPSLAWREPNALLVDHDNIGKKSLPEYGLNLSKKNMPLLEAYAFDGVVAGL